MTSDGQVASRWKLHRKGRLEHNTKSLVEWIDIFGLQFISSSGFPSVSLEGGFVLGTGGCQLTATDLLVTSNSHRRQMTVHRLHFFTLACCFVVDDALISFFS